MELHDIVIITLIGIILIFQLKVFRQAKSKISLFNNVMPEQQSYKTIKVFVREDDIEKITLNEIFDEIDLYKSDDFEKRERKRQLKEKLAQKKKNKGKNNLNEDVENERYIDINENETLDNLDKDLGNHKESFKTVEEINKASEEIIKSIKQNSKRDLFKD